MNWNKIILLGVLCLSLSACSSKKETVVDNSSRLIINGQTIKLELAKSDDERRKGLSGRAKLCDDCGMLFIFPAAGRTAFWMKDMKFPLDLIGIKNQKVVAIDENAKPESGKNMTPYQYKVDVDSVLEVNAGMVKKAGIKVGDGVWVQGI